MPFRDAKTPHSSSDHRKRASLYVVVIAIALSLFAFSIVVTQVAIGTPRQADESTWAHLFQLAMAAQIPLGVTFFLVADWRRPRYVALLLLVQVFAVTAALTALAWSGY